MSFNREKLKTHLRRKGIKKKRSKFTMRRMGKRAYV